MALTSKKYSDIHDKTGDEKALLQAKFDNKDLILTADNPDDYPQLAALIYQIGLMQEELDYLRTEISSNKDKATFPGFGTSSGTALAGDTTTISTAQANAITANTAKTSMEIGSKATQAMAGNTTIPTVTVTTSAGTLLVQFGLTTGKSTTLDIVVTDKSDPKGDVTYVGSVALTQKK